MNKILKIFLKKPTYLNDDEKRLKPIEKVVFKYVVDDYPYYETAFMDNTFWEYLTVKNAHSLLRLPIEITQGLNNIKVNPKFLSRITSFKDKTFSIMSVRARTILVVKNIDFKLLNSYKVIARANKRAMFIHKDYPKLKLTPRGIILAKLKSHDPYTLQNRDSKTLQNMDETILF